MSPCVIKVLKNNCRFSVCPERYFYSHAGTRLPNVEKARNETADPAPRLDILTHFWSLLIIFTVYNYLSINILSV